MMALAAALDNLVSQRDMGAHIFDDAFRRAFVISITGNQIVAYESSKWITLVGSQDRLPLAVAIRQAHSRWVHTLADMAAKLNRSTVYLSGPQRWFELPAFEGADYAVLTEP